MKQLKVNISLTALMVIALCSPVFGMPTTINHQGYLTDNGGAPIDGSVTATFRLYDVLTGGSPLWEDTISVSADNGSYSVILGDPPGIALDPTIFTKQLYLAVQVSGEAAEMAPRHKLASTPYSIRALTVEEGGLLYIKDNGVIIGRLVSVADNPSGGKIYTLFTPEGYRGRLAAVDPAGTTLAYHVGDLPTPLIYESGDCTGTPYVEKLLNPGVVLCDASNSCYYTDKNATQTFITPGSYYDGTCNTSSSPGGWRLPLIANDEGVTGIVANGVYNGPITVSER